MRSDSIDFLVLKRKEVSVKVPVTAIWRSRVTRIPMRSFVLSRIRVRISPFVLQLQTGEP
jgi:hypothetical protein